MLLPARRAVVLGQQLLNLPNGRRHGSARLFGESLVRSLGVRCLDADDKRQVRKHAKSPGHHQRTRRGSQMHVRKLVAASVDAQPRYVEDHRSLDHDRACRSPEVDSVDDQQRLRVADHQLLHQTDSPDTDLENLDPRWQAGGGELFRYRHTDTVVSPQDVAETGHQHGHMGRIDPRA